MRKKLDSPLARRFFAAAKKNDEAFLRELTRLFRIAGKRHGGENAAIGERHPADSASVVRERTSAPRLQYSNDTASCTVGEALRQYLNLNNIPTAEAAEQLKISVESMQELLSEMMPLTSSTVGGVAQFFNSEYRIPALTLRQWLITGLRDCELRASEQGTVRLAARSKKK